MADKVVQIQKDIKDKAEDYREFLADLKTWESEIGTKDSTVSKKNKLEADYPPIRGTVDEAAVLKMQEEREKDDPILRQKDLGNEYFKKGKYGAAAEAYAKGIEYDPDDKNVFVLHGNRAMAFLKVEAYADAEAEASKCVGKNRTYTKGFFRRALARRAQGKLKEALEDFSTVLVLEPDNREAKTQLAQVQTEIRNKEKEEKKAAAAPRKKLQIEEVDDDDDDDEDEDEADEVEIPIRRKEDESAKAKPEPAPTPAPKETKRPAPSGPIELLDDDDDEPVGKSLLNRHVDPAAPSPLGEEAKPKPSPAPAAKEASPTPAPAAQKSGSPAGSPKGKKVIQPSDTVMKALAQSKRTMHKEVPTSFLHFERVWETLEGKPEERADYLRLIPKEKYGEFFKSNVTEEVLSDTVRIMHDTLVHSDEADVKRVFNITKQLSKLDRLAALLIFADEDVSEKLENIPSLLGKSPVVPEADLKVLTRDLKARLSA
eukprot:TRINITY_DN11812_c1_g1_i1.p1 TRINITY_DN11812_c1_g1~~TRINITY_DN11812_c1_g1_i1.p1  ORF type:complete len:508 (+),score=222.22 TRINITY_DN11812_c1_g1_i1:68-1525(+)